MLCYVGSPPLFGHAKYYVHYTCVYQKLNKLVAKCILCIILPSQKGNYLIKVICLRNYLIGLDLDIVCINTT